MIKKLVDFWNRAWEWIIEDEPFYVKTEHTHYIEIYESLQAKLIQMLPNINCERKYLVICINLLEILIKGNLEHLRREKTRRLLFLILNNKIEYWWL